VLAWGDSIFGTSYTSLSPMAKLFDSFIKMTSSRNIITKGDSYGLSVSGNNVYGFINGKRNMASYYIDDSWNHIAYIYDKNIPSANIEIYVNGISQDYFDINSNIISSLSNLRIGESFSGSISDTRIYDRALSRSEILALYNLRNTCGNGICEAEFSENESTCISDCGIPDIDRGLMAYYPLDGINFVNDISGNLNHMTNNGPILSTGIKNENEDSYSFDGIDDYMVMPEILTFENNYNLFTISGWINPEKSSWFINPYSAGIDQFIGYNAGAQMLYVAIAESADTNQRSYPSRYYSVPVDRWSYYTVVIDNLNIKIYVNGVLENSVSESSSIAYWQGYWNVGKRINDTFHYEGKMSDIRLYNRALTSAEVLQLYNSNLPIGSSCGDGNCGVGETYLNCSTDCTSPDLSDIDLSCYDILLKGKSTGNGIYTIDPDGVGGENEFEVYCDMTTNGGGWTMIMKLKSDGQDLDFDSPYWENTDLLNPTDL
ncbi:MAG: hypothetical protein EOL97_16455, partial [Spirochaetia bacterium]|nr:hypothetical protein [Spirochaetia bacterium]